MESDAHLLVQDFLSVQKDMLQIKASIIELKQDNERLHLDMRSLMQQYNYLEDEHKIETKRISHIYSIIGDKKEDNSASRIAPQKEEGK
jgi:hypothetical protein